MLSTLNPIQLNTAVNANELSKRCPENSMSSAFQSVASVWMQIV